MVLSDIVVILCRAGEPGNVGAVCRVMKNMGLSRLRLVTPEPSKSRLFMEETTLLARAIHAGDIWRNARFFDTLAGATADCSLVVGTTRRRGRKRKNVTLEPRALIERLASLKGDQNHTPVALVFGNERTGLEEEELNFCNIASHIPVSEAFPSLNLSHAVQIYAYELFLAFGDTLPSVKNTSSPESVKRTRRQNNPVKGEWVPLTRPAVDKLTADITGALAAIGFYRQPGREEQTRFLRDLICRAGLTEREGRYLKDIFIKAARLGSK